MDTVYLKLAIRISYTCIGFTTKVRIKTDEEAVELDSKGPLDDHSEVEPGMYVNTEVVTDSIDEKPVASNGNQHKYS